ncbi:MAG: substrate-binding domain-containing protein [Flavicella sp.]|nr:substrate-binding domain-containing protein [Flavicella sp.]
MTIKDIAKLAKVSEGTIDRVIHNRSGVSQKTKERVQKILNEHNFEKNIIASTLAYKKKYTIATLIPNSKSKKKFWFEPDQGIKKAVDEIKKFGVTTHSFYFNEFDSESFSKTFEKLLKVNPDGVLLAPVFYRLSKELIKKLDDKKIPYLFINTNIDNQKNITFIGQNSFQSGYLSAKIMDLTLDEGDKIIIVKSQRDSDNHFAIDSRIKGFFDYYKKLNSSKKIILTTLENFTAKKIEEYLLLEQFGKGFVNGIFVPSSHTFKIAKFLKKNELQSIFLLGYDASIENSKYLKNDTINFLIDQEPFNQGYKGVKALFDYLFFNISPNITYNSPINIITKENLEFMM